MDLVRRDAWGASPPRGKPVTIATPVRSLYLHHSASPDGGPGTVRGIQRFHMEVRGFADIAYSWLYSPRDRVFYEGRGPGIQQAAQRGHNKTSHSVCVMGNYERDVPPRHVIADLAEWGDWHGGTWGPSIYTPHLEVSATACPGKYLMAWLDDINAGPQSTPAPVEPHLPPTLRRGDTGDDVKLLQAAVMPHDGRFGPQTERAVRDYQQANGLKVDGICGPATWRSILDL
jgi:peptidoglycan hydrolase-like protein with peptidoglycan-binding domain